jgi:formamidopyrimidine-DNA glycosylase
MPELPEVEHLRRSLEPHILGARVTAATLFREDICTHTSLTGTAARALLAGERISATRRLGKQLAIIADSGRALCIHLGMSGQLLVHAHKPERGLTHVHAQWELARPSGPAQWLLFRDPRRFGGLWTFPSAGLLDTHWAHIGPDALTISGEHLHQQEGARARPIKSALLDQSLLAGVGNIYADEALFGAGLAPQRPGRTLTPDDWQRLARVLRTLLTRAVEAGGTTLRDYRDADGRTGNAGAAHAVYGRAGHPCLRCAAPLDRAEIAQRTTVWCAVCQR